MALKQDTLQSVAKKPPQFRQLLTQRRVRNERDVFRTLKKIAEKKKFDFSQASASIDYSGAIYSITDVAQGDTDVTRDGDQLTPLRLEVRGAFVVGDAVNANRIVIVRWLPLDSSMAPAVASVLEVTGSALAPYSPYQHDNLRAGYFEVLYDTFFVEDTYSPIKQFYIDLNIPQNKKMAFNAASTNGSGKLFLIAISDSAAATHPNIQFISRLWFLGD